jgi:hypothetical protein
MAVLKTEGNTLQAGAADDFAVSGFTVGPLHIVTITFSEECQSYRLELSVREAQTLVNKLNDEIKLS